MQLRIGHENTPRAQIYDSSKQFVPLPNDKISDWSKLKAFADDKLKVVKMNKFVLDRVEKKAGSQHFLLFHNVFQCFLCQGLERDF